METKNIQFESVTLKNVLTPEGERDIVAQIVPFDRRKDEHVDFAFECADMYGRQPSRFSNVSDAARAFVELFMVHKADDATDPNSDYVCVLRDKRAARTLYHTPAFQQQLQDFFVND